MSNYHIFEEIKSFKKDPKFSRLIEIFEHTEEILGRIKETSTIKQKQIKKGTYSASISTKDYYANISTTTQ